MRGEPAPGVRDVSCGLAYRVGRDTALPLRVLRGVAGVVSFESGYELLEGLPARDEAVSLVFLPIDPLAHERGVEPARVKDHLGHGEEHCGLGAGMRGEP